MKNQLDRMAALASAAVVMVLVYSVYPAATYDDKDGECLGLSNCTDWACPPGGDGDDDGDELDQCFPCSDENATFEHCGGNSGPGCSSTVTAGGCGVDLPSGLCSNAQESECITLPPGPNAPACDSRTCAEDILQ